MELPHRLTSLTLTLFVVVLAPTQRSECPPFHAIAGLITWHTHEAHDLAAAARLFDLFLASTPLLPLYLTGELLRANRAKVHTRPRRRFRHTHGRRRLLLRRWCGQHARGSTSESRTARTRIARLPKLT